MSRRGDGADADPSNPANVSSAPGPRRDDDSSNRTFGAPNPSAAAAALFLRRFALEFGSENSNAARSIAAKWPVGVLDRERLLRRADALGPDPREKGRASGPPTPGVACVDAALVVGASSSPCAAPASLGAPA